MQNKSAGKVFKLKIYQEFTTITLLHFTIHQHTAENMRLTDLPSPMNELHIISRFRKKAFLVLSMRSAETSNTIQICLFRSRLSQEEVRNP